MKYVLCKRGKYMVGHSYATGIGYSFHWSFNKSEARQFDPDTEPCFWSFAKRTGAHGVEVVEDREGG